jgi:hypothetical protein
MDHAPVSARLVAKIVLVAAAVQAVVRDYWRFWKGEEPIDSSPEAAAEAG